MPNKRLTVGMVGEDVAALQQALAALGFSIPEAEGKRRFFGPGTREAVNQCQARMGLMPEEICAEASDRGDAQHTAEMLRERSATPPGLTRQEQPGPRLPLPSRPPALE